MLFSISLVLFKQSGISKTVFFMVSARVLFSIAAVCTYYSLFLEIKKQQKTDSQLYWDGRLEGARETER